MAGPFVRNWKATTGSSNGVTLTAYTQETTMRPNAWDVDLQVTGSINWARKGLTT